MIRYFFLPSGREIYVHAARSLKKKDIAEPVLWCGDNRIDHLAERYFPGTVITHPLFNKLHTFYMGSYYCSDSEFFLSENYFRLKDRCLKMMDRVDDLGCFSRIDREALIYKLCLWWLKKIDNLSPDAIVLCDAPHTHEVYSLYEVALFFEIPVGMVKQWGIAPCAYMYVEFDGLEDPILARLGGKYSSDLKLHNFIDEYFSGLLQSAGAIGYEPIYMKTQRLNSGFFSRNIGFVMRQYKRYMSGALTAKRIVNYPFLILKTYFLDGIKNIKDGFRFILRNIYVGSDVDPQNPLDFLMLKRRSIIRRRRSNLKKSYESLSSSVQGRLNSTKYIYIPLHYEPEASTNPEGDIFGDQLIAILNLRRWVPDDACIYVKEHPSQFYSHSAFGYLGRSVYFYQVLSAIKGVKLVSIDSDSLSLINNSVFVATITGTVAVEAAALGKKVIFFGNPWYKGMPNSFYWDPHREYYDFLNKKVDEAESVKSFLHHIYDASAVPMMLNPSGIDMYPEFECGDYQDEELKCAVHLMSRFFDLLK